MKPKTKPFNHHEFESPPVDWDRQEARELEIECIAAEILDDGEADSWDEAVSKAELEFEQRLAADQMAAAEDAYERMMDR